MSGRRRYRSLESTSFSAKKRGLSPNSESQTLENLKSNPFTTNRNRLSPDLLLETPARIEPNEGAKNPSIESTPLNTYRTRSQFSPDPEPDFGDLSRIGCRDGAKKLNLESTPFSTNRSCFSPDLELEIPARIENKEGAKKLILEPTSELIVGLVIDDLIHQMVEKNLDSGQENYDDMQNFFTSRIEIICKVSYEESYHTSEAMIKACKEAFPCPNRDLRAQYITALEVERKKNNYNLPKFHAKSAQNQANSWLLDFRRSLHSQLSQKVKHKQKNLYRFSEIVDLIVSYLHHTADTV